MKILVTGASGFVGTEMIRHLCDKGDFRIIAALHHQIPVLPNGVDFVKVAGLTVTTDWIKALHIGTAHV